MIDLNDYAHTAAQHGWGAGWPSCDGARVAGLEVVAAPRSGVGVSVNRRIARLVASLVAETERRGYLLRAGQCWGYACRAIAGTAVASNHCLTGGTKVVTYDGPVAIRDLAGTTATLLTRDPFGVGLRGRWIEAPVRAYGTEPTYELVLGRGGARKVIRGTGRHRWFAQRKTSTYAKGRSRVATEERTTLELRPGDRLARCLPPPMPARLAPSSYGIAHGAVLGRPVEFTAQAAARRGIACREPVDTVPDRPAEQELPGWKVESVVATGQVEDVFCATVDGYGAFTLDGWLLTGNSWGLAVDINSLANPYQFPRRTDMPTWMPLLWNRYGFAWGGNYNDNGRLGKADSMHYEFMGTPADADQMTALALYELSGVYDGASSRKDDPVAVIPITVAADNTFRSAVMAEAGGDSIVVARAWITLGSTWGHTSFTVTALDGGGRILTQQRFDVPNNNTRVLELPGGSKLATVEGRTDPKALPAAALISLNR